MQLLACLDRIAGMTLSTNFKGLYKFDIRDPKRRQSPFWNENLMQNIKKSEPFGEGLQMIIKVKKE